MSLPPASAKKPSRAAVLRLGGTLLTLALLIYLLRQQGWAEIEAALMQIGGWRLAVALLLTLVSRLAVTGRWHVLLRSAGMPITAGQTTRLTFAGLFASNFLPTTIGGDVFRLAGAVQLNFDAAVSAASLVADRLVGMAGMALALPLAAPVFFQNQTGLSQAGLASTLPLMGLLSSGPRRWVSRLVERGQHLWQGMLATLSGWLKQPRVLLAALAFTGVHMLCLFLSISILLEGMGEPMPMWKIAGLWSAVYFITLVPISVNGYGLQEVSTHLLYSTIGGLSEPVSLILALLIRTLTMLASLPGALYVPGILAAQKPSAYGKS